MNVHVNGWCYLQRMLFVQVFVQKQLFLYVCKSFSFSGSILFSLLHNKLPLPALFKFSVHAHFVTVSVSSQKFPSFPAETTPFAFIVRCAILRIEEESAYASSLLYFYSLFPFWYYHSCSKSSCQLPQARSGRAGASNRLLSCVRSFHKRILTILLSINCRWPSSKRVAYSRTHVLFSLYPGP